MAQLKEQTWGMQKKLNLGINYIDGIEDIRQCSGPVIPDPTVNEEAWIKRGQALRIARASELARQAALSSGYTTEQAEGVASAAELSLRIAGQINLAIKDGSVQPVTKSELETKN